MSHKTVESLGQWVDRVWSKSRVDLTIDKMSTLRKKIAEALKGDSLDLREISKLFGMKEKEVLDHLNHMEKSVHHRDFTGFPKKEGALVDKLINCRIDHSFQSSYL